MEQRTLPELDPVQWSRALYLNQIHYSGAEHYWIAAAAAALPPAVPEESTDPEGQQRHPHRPGNYQIVEPELTRVHVGDIVGGVVHVATVRGYSGAGGVVGDSQT